MILEDPDDLAALALLPGLPEAALLAALTDRIAALLRQDPDGLRQALYRIDVSEGAARAAAVTLQPAQALAGLVLARVREKAASRVATRPGRPAPGDELAW